MATPVDTLLIEIKAETANLRKGLESVNTRLKNTNKMAASSVLNFGNLAKIFAVIGFGRIASEVVRTTQMFEDLEATLQANTGNALETATALDMIKKFTATTTFQIDEVTRAFIEFRRIGIKATEADLRGIGNVAAAQGVSIDQISAAIFKAGTTSIESLQMLGFTGKTEGDKITLAFGDITDTVDKSAEGVLGFVRSVGELKFADAITKRADTLSGAFSNLGDATSFFMAEIGEGGLKDLLIDVARDFSVLLVNSLETARSIGLVLKLAFDKLTEALGFVFNAVKRFKDELVALMSILIVTKLAGIGLALVRVTKSFVMAASAAKLFNIFLKANPAFLIIAGLTVLTGTLDEVGTMVQDLIGKFDEATGASATLDNIIKELSVDTSELTNELEGLEDTTDGVIKGTKQLTSTFSEELKGAVSQAANSFTNDFVNALMQGQNKLESFKNFSQQVVSQIISIFLQLAVVNKLLNQIFGVGTFDEFDLATGKIVKAKQAGGGAARADMPTLVGERGPEIFIPHSAGNILNNMNTKNALAGSGGVVVNQNINFATGINATVRNEVIQLLPQIADVTKAAVQEKAARSNRFKGAFSG
tara:strand:- start:11743 stop:13521 length:1779 start_codon:yes stop_codon:yes gene_type:complete